MRLFCALLVASSKYTDVLKVIFMIMGSATYFLGGIGIVLRKGLSRSVEHINDLPMHNW